MIGDPCKTLREIYDVCFQEWVDKEYLLGTVKGPMVPCEKTLKEYHECLLKDPRRSKFLLNLDQYKKDSKD